MRNLRKYTVLALAMLQTVSASFNTLTGRGQSIVEFARDGDSVLRAANYAFAIWGLLYAGCLAFAVFQAWPRKVETPLAQRLGWWAAIAFACNSAWTVAAELDAKLLTILIIFLGAAALNIGLRRAVAKDAAPSRQEQALVLWPLAGLAGWVTIAAALNFVTEAKAMGWIAALPMRGEAWALFSMAVATAVAITFLLRTRLYAFALTFIWGLVAVAVAERGPHPDLAGIAVGASVLTIGAIAIQAALRWRRRSRVAGAVAP